MNHRDLCWLSARVYDDARVFAKKAAVEQFAVLRSYDHAGTQAVHVRGKQADALVFRGTEASNLKFGDIWSNFTWPYPTRWQGMGRVHSGYRTHLNMVGFEALQMVEQVQSTWPVYVTGHSLGGAIATLFAAWYYYDNRKQEPPYKLAGLVTFGSPKPMNREAALTIGCPIHRYAVRGDFAPFWPPVMALKHPAPAIWLPARSAFHGPLRRHTPDTYLRGVTSLTAVQSSEA